jgi:hypothetical protein
MEQLVGPYISSCFVISIIESGTRNYTMTQSHNLKYMHVTVKKIIPIYGATDCLQKEEKKKIEMLDAEPINSQMTSPQQV